MIRTSRCERPTAASVSGTPSSSSTGCISISWAWSTSSPITDDGIRPPVAVTAAWTIDSAVGLHAVARDRDVVDLGGVQGVEHVDPVRRVGGHGLDEELLGHGEVVLAPPQRVVGVEPDRVELLASRHAPDLRVSS